MIQSRNGGKDIEDNVIIACGKCVNIIHALEAIESASRYIECCTLFMNWRKLLIYSIKELMRELKRKMKWK